MYVVTNCRQCHYFNCPEDAYYASREIYVNYVSDFCTSPNILIANSYCILIPLYYGWINLKSNLKSFLFVKLTRQCVREIVDKI